MIKLSRQAGFMHLVVIAVLALVLLVAGFLYISKKDAASDTTSPTPQPVQPTHPKQTEPKTFDPQGFYDQIQNGMDYATLNQLANKTGDCIITDVYPAPTSYPCYWSDNKYIVRVTLSSQGVTNKSIHPNNSDNTN